MKKALTFINILLVVLAAQAQNTIFHTDKLWLSIDDEGYISSLTVCDKNILSDSSYPILMGCHNGRLALPQAFEPSYGTLYNVVFDDGGEAILDIQELGSHLKITIERQNIHGGDYDAMIICPVMLNINEVVGDIIGVVQGKGVAFGIQALNIKTNAGIPQEYAGKISERLHYEGEPASVSTSSLPAYRLSATRTKKGAMMQFSARYRGRLEYRNVQGVDSVMVLPIENCDRLIDDASVALFGCPQNEALSRIGEIEIAENLPHPMFDGEWGKTSRSAMKPYIISDFSENDFDFVLEKCHQAGMEYVYHIEPFEDWGHFHWSKDFVKGGKDNDVRMLVEKAESQGIHVGIHTLSNFTTTNDSYVSPRPSEHLLKQGIVKLQEGIDESQTDFAVYHSDLFARPMTLNLLQIDDELISYRTTEVAGNTHLLHSCTRGAYGTKKSAHAKNATVYKLWDHPYKVVFPDLVLQDSLAQRLVEIFNHTGLSQISFDGLEGCTYTGHDDYATSHFVSQCYEGWDHNVLNDASQLNHYNWHIHSRMNWGEPWGEAMRTGQVEARIKNQDFFRRNLFPRMLGWFKISLADRKYECTTIEDVEWAMSECAGFDAGYGMTIYMNAMRNHGQLDAILETMRYWDQLRLADAFNDDLKARLKDPYTEWHLEKLDDSTFNLYEMHISRRFRCDLADMQPGQPGGADWQWDSHFSGRYALRLHVEGEGQIQNPYFQTADGVLAFECTLKAGQYLLYDFNGKAVITDSNYNYIETIEKQGVSMLPEGSSTISFSCDTKKGDKMPEVTVRFITRDKPETVKLSVTSPQENAPRF